MTLYVIGYFVLGAIVEISSLRVLSDNISVLNTLSLIMLAFIIGVFMGRSWGEEYFEKLQWHLRSGTMPADEVVDGSLMALGSIMLITPGVVSDFLALLIFIPAIRTVFKKMIISMMRKRIAQGQPYFFYKD